MPFYASLLLGAVFGDPAPVSFGERAPEGSGFKIRVTKKVVTPPADTAPAM